MTTPTEANETHHAAPADDPSHAGEQQHTADEPNKPAESPEARSRAAKRKKMLIRGGSVLALLALCYGVYYLIWSMHHEETDDAYVTGHLHPISARIADTVARVLVDDNEHVTQGQTLVLLDPKDFQVRVDQATAALDAAYRQADTAQATISNSAQTATAETMRAKGAIGEAKASIAAQKAAVLSIDASVSSAQARLNEANVTLQKDRADLHRYEDLAAKDQVSRQTLDHARATYQVSLATQAAAEQAVKEAQAKLLQAKEDVGRTEAMLTTSYSSMEEAKAAGIETTVRGQQFQAAKAAVSQAQAALEAAKLDLSYAVITAPVAGKIGRKSVEAGQRVQIGQPLMAVVEDRLWIVANYKETQLEKMRPGQAVEMKIDTFPGHTFHGHVDSLAPGSGNEFALLPPDNATGNFTKIVQRIPVKIVFDPDSVRGYENLVAPGMSATVTVTTH